MAVHAEKQFITEISAVPAKSPELHVNRKENLLQSPPDISDTALVKSIDQLSSAELEKIVALKKQIEAILNGSSVAPALGKARAGKRTRKPTSDETKKKLAKAAKARWDKVRAAREK
jgi:hypothetical protein